MFVDLQVQTSFKTKGHVLLIVNSFSIVVSHTLRYLQFFFKAKTIISLVVAIQTHFFSFICSSFLFSFHSSESNSKTNYMVSQYNSQKYAFRTRWECYKDHIFWFGAWIQSRVKSNLTKITKFD